MTTSVHILRERVDKNLDHILTRGESNAASKTLSQAMRYSVLGGGKRLRALLVYGGGQCVDASTGALDWPAAAVEMLHAYSLVHDDLPAMDDDELRRGKPTCHVQFDEATAILAGDALQTLAFGLITGDESAQYLSTDQQARICRILSGAAGANGMVGGQMLDLEAENTTLDLEHLQQIHRAKTGALIGASVQMGALCAENLPEQQAMDALTTYGNKIGLAFQIIDDILDVESDTQTLGKPVGSDQQMNKLTYPVLLGLDASRKKAAELHEEAVASLEPFGDNKRLLVELAALITKRDH